MSQQLLANKIILVTGAGNGIGRAAAKSFAAHGATVILLGPNLKQLEKVYDEIEALTAPQPAIYAMNFQGACLNDYQQLQQTLAQEFGQLNGLLHNAATLGVLSPLEHYSVETWYKVIQVNLNAVFLLTQACLPLLKQADTASLLLTSDQVGRKAKAYWGAYAVAKAGLEALMQLLAAELDNSQIKVNSFDPGAIATALRATAYPAENPNKLLTANEISWAYVYLMSDLCQEMGQALDLAQLDNKKSLIHIT